MKSITFYLLILFINRLLQYMNSSFKLRNIHNILYLNIFYVQINRKVVEYNQLSKDSSGESAGDRREAVRTRTQLAIKRLEKQINRSKTSESVERIVQQRAGLQKAVSVSRCRAHFTRTPCPQTAIVQQESACRWSLLPPARQPAPGRTPGSSDN